MMIKMKTRIFAALAVKGLTPMRLHVRSAGEDFLMYNSVIISGVTVRTDHDSVWIVISYSLCTYLLADSLNSFFHSRSLSSSCYAHEVVSSLNKHHVSNITFCMGLLSFIGLNGRPYM